MMTTMSLNIPTVRFLVGDRQLSANQLNIEGYIEVSG